MKQLIYTVLGLSLALFMAVLFTEREETTEIIQMDYTEFPVFEDESVFAAPEDISHMEHVKEYEERYKGLHMNYFNCVCGHITPTTSMDEQACPSCGIKFQFDEDGELRTQEYIFH